jgi:hypothetical protein
MSMQHQLRVVVPTWNDMGKPVLELRERDPVVRACLKSATAI